MINLKSFQLSGPSFERMLECFKKETFNLYFFFIYLSSTRLDRKLCNSAVCQSMFAYFQHIFCSQWTYSGVHSPGAILICCHTLTLSPSLRSVRNKVAWIPFTGKKHNLSLCCRVCFRQIQICLSEVETCHFFFFFFLTDRCQFL